MIRKILLIDDTDCMRKILQQKIMANLNDIEIVEVKDTAEAAETLTQKTCHLIILSWHPKVTGASPFLSRLRASLQNGHIPILLLSADREEKQIQSLLEAGANECLYHPTSARILAETINRICNPVNLRQSERYSFSTANVSLEQKRHYFDGKLINISLGGLLCEMDWQDEFDCGSPMMLRVEITLGGERIVVKDLYSRIVNLRLIEANSDHTFRRVRAAFAFLQVSTEAREGLEKAFRLSEAQERGCVLAH